MREREMRGRHRESIPETPEATRQFCAPGSLHRFHLERIRRRDIQVNCDTWLGFNLLLSTWYRLEKESNSQSAAWVWSTATTELYYSQKTCDHSEESRLAGQGLVGQAKRHHNCSLLVIVASACPLPQKIACSHHAPNQLYCIIIPFCIKICPWDSIWDPEKPAVRARISTFIP